MNKWAAVLLSYPLCVSADDAVKLDQVYITGGANKIQTQPGSATLIDDVALEQFEYTDIHRILNEVPGVNIQEEDGYGLRPNIGMRGSSAERSKKITIMEDGVLTGPAPYSAPAAYYFPNVSRMSAVEVFKGPSAIQYGPATVAGALNMVSRPIPYINSGEVDAQLGSFGYQRLNAYYGGQQGDVGFLIEGLTLSADGFKDLDSQGTSDGPFDGDTGFERNDVNIKSSYDFNDQYRQRITLKLGYADETSHETYVGLSRDDFDADPYRRYAASALDNMQWEHTQFQLTHVIEPTTTSQVTTDVYRNAFSRDWFKLNSFNGSNVASIEEILRNPNTGNHLGFYEVLTGKSLSNTAAEQLLIGNNGRDFVSQGIQTRYNLDSQLFGIPQQVEVGFRVHQDEIERNHTQQAYDMTVNGLVTASGSSLQTSTKNTGEATAIAAYIKNDMSLGDTTLSVGLRSETIETTLTNHLTNDVKKATESVLVPGAGIFTQLSENFGVLAGVHKGYVATAPGQEGDIDPEESINYEFGFRVSGQNNIEVVAYVNDYSNLKESCNASNGCSTAQLDSEFNGGEVFVYGVESHWKTAFQLNDAMRTPLTVTYTFTQTEFENSFQDVSGVFKQKGATVEKGDELAYVPAHRLNIKTGIEAEKWQLLVSALYQSDMRGNAGQGSIAAEDKIDAYAVFDLAANYKLRPELTLYSTIDNVFDDDYVVAGQPMGFRPGKPRSAHVGVKYQF
ncbi:TonB-dependent receptor family protein [Pseudomonas sp. HK3]